MNQCNLALNASVNTKQQPNAIIAHGSVIVFTDETEVSITRADPQGMVSTTLLLRLEVTPHPGPMKGTPRAFHYEESGDHVSEYTHVQVTSNHGDNRTVRVEVFG